MKWVKIAALYFASLSACAIFSPHVVRASPGEWVDISESMRKVLGSEAIIPPGVYLRRGFPVTVKSLNLRGVVYKRAVLSWAAGSMTVKRDLLFDCSSYSYKENDGTPGYWYAMNWILPDNQDSSVDAAAFRYFCSGSKSPWMYLASNVDDEHFYLNSSAAYQLKLAKYGRAYTWVVAKIDKHSAQEMLRLYLSCGVKRVGFYSLIDAAGDQGVILDEPNPGSIGEGIVRDLC